MAVDAHLLKQLAHSDPTQRRKAIVTLADSRDLAALDPLDETSRTDPDPKLRSLAERAARHLKEQAERAAAFAASPETAREAAVTDKDRLRAKGHLDEALSLYIAGDNAKATKALAKALQANPALRHDSYFLSLIGQVFDADPQQALELLASGDKRGEFIRQAEKGKVQRRKNDHHTRTEELGWSSVVFDLSVYGLVIAVITFLAPFVAAQMVSQAVAHQNSLSPEALAEETIVLPPELQTLPDVLQSSGPIGALLTALVNGVVSALLLLATGWLIHQIATRMLGGNGTLRYLLCQLVPFYSMMTPVFFIWLCILMGFVAIGAAFIGLLCLPVMSLAGLVVFFKAAGKVGAAYDFGAAKGCLSLVIASALLELVALAFSSLLFGSVISSITG